MAFDERKAQRVLNFIECLKHTKGEFHGKPFLLLPWQRQIVSDVFGTVRDDNPHIRQYTQAYIEIPKKQGKSELGAALALNMLTNDDEWRAEVYSCASDRQQAGIVFDVAVDMVKQSPALMKRIRIIPSTKRMIYDPTGSMLSASAAPSSDFPCFFGISI
jgi:phage terminase large subunit-like protein